MKTDSFLITRKFVLYIFYLCSILFNNLQISKHPVAQFCLLSIVMYKTLLFTLKCPH